jgi:glycosyltransferase involved in cell wall biosynthesis
MTSASSVVSIVLPTFDRPHLLPTAVRSLLDQTPFSVRIIDDGSSVPADVVLQNAGLLPKHAAQLSVERNSCNCGLHFNCLRALEQCDTRFLWIFSDDVSAHANSASAILDSVSAFPDCVAHFWHPMESTRASPRVMSLAGFLSFIEEGSMHFGLSDLFFNRVLNVQRARRYFRVDAQLGHAQPHLALQLAALSSGESLVLHAGELATTHAAEASWWTFGHLMRHKFDVADAIEDLGARERYRTTVASRTPWRSVLIEPAVRDPRNRGAALLKDAAAMVVGSDVPLKLRVEAGLALMIAKTRIVRTFMRWLRRVHVKS